MRQIMTISGKVIPLQMNDVDTDLIIPAQYLTSTQKSGYGSYLFSRLRGANADFVFNQTQYANANILITGANFGCGSSREHAVWALQEAGIEAIIAVSFADIFSSNAAKNGLVLITQPEDIITKLLNYAGEMNIDISGQKLTIDSGESFEFDINSFRKYCFMNGLDDLDYLLQHKREIEKYKIAPLALPVPEGEKGADARSAAGGFLV